MVMASASLNSLSPLNSFTSSLCKPKTPKFLQVRAQSLSDEGNSSNKVDANLNVLRARIDELTRNEKLEQGSKKLKNIGWQNNSSADYYHERQAENAHGAMLMETMEVVGLVSGSIGVVFLFGTLSIFLVSFVVQLYI